MKNIYFVFVLSFLGTGALLAQESATYTHYQLFPVYLNPAAAGMHHEHEVIFNFRNRWAAHDGSPKTFSLLYNGLFSDNVGFGARLYSEKIGRLRKTYGQLDYAYKFMLDDFEMSIGLSTGIEQYRLSSVADDPFIDPSDELLIEALDGSLLFDAGAGIYGQQENGLQFGVSFPNLIRSRLADIAGEDDYAEEDEFNFAVFLGYEFDVTNYNFKVAPSILIQDVRFVPFQIDLNVLMKFLDEQLVGGLTYSVSEENRFGVMIGTRIDALRFYYSYDVSFGDFQKFNNGSHELTVNYRFGNKKMSQDEGSGDAEMKMQ